MGENLTPYQIKHNDSIIGNLGEFREHPAMSKDYANAFIRKEAGRLGVPESEFSLIEIIIPPSQASVFIKLLGDAIVEKKIIRL